MPSSDKDLEHDDDHERGTKSLGVVQSDLLKKAGKSWVLAAFVGCANSPPDTRRS